MTEALQIEHLELGQIKRVEPPEVTSTPDGEVHTLLVVRDDGEGNRVPLGEVVARPYVDSGYKAANGLAIPRRNRYYKEETSLISAMAGSAQIYSEVVHPFVGPMQSPRTPQQLAEASSNLQHEAAKVVLAHFGFDFNPKEPPQEK